MAHSHLTPPPGGSVLGPEHERRARQMTGAAALAAAAVCALLGLLCVPLVLVLPVGFVLYVTSEAVFAVLYWYRYLLLSYQPIKHRPLSHDPIASLTRTLQHLRGAGADIRSFLSIWFHGAHPDSIRRGNVKELVAYAFWYKTPAEVAAEGRGDELEQQVAAMEDTWGIRLEPGYDPQLTCMAHLWEPMKHWYKPLAFYAAMEAAALLCRVALQAAGFQRHVWMGLAYFTRNMPAQQIRPSTDLPAGFYRSGSGLHVHQSARAAARAHGSNSRGSSSQQVPLVLVHGIGMGLVPYISMLFNMAATGRPVLALELPHISQRWVLWVPTVDEVTEVLVSILNRNAITACCLVGHSYGTAVASRLLQQAPQRITQLALVDPICFTMFMPNLLRNFLYESPHSGSRVGDFMMLSAARDLHVAATLSRRFFWSEVNLWEEQVPPDTLVVLSGRDALMAAPQVRTWLQKHTQAVVMFHPDLVHAGFLLDIPWQQHILRQLLLLLDSRASRDSGARGTGWQPPHGGQQGGGSGSGKGPAGSGSNSSRSSKHTGGMLSDTAPAASTGAAGGTHGGSLVHSLQGVPTAAAAAPPGVLCGGDAGARANSQPHMSQPGNAALPSGDDSSSSSSVQSFQSCQGSGSSSTSASTPATPTSLVSVTQQHQAAAALSQMQLQASPFSLGCYPSADNSTDRLAAGGSLGLGSASASGRLPSYGSLNNIHNSSSSQLLPGSSFPSRSREGSLELASSLCMRSWSGVLPCAPAGAAAGGGLGAAEASAASAETGGGPESPRSCSTFVSASSVQSRRSLAAAAAALEARQAAHLLLKPLMALQQRRHQQHQHHHLLQAEPPGSSGPATARDGREMPWEQCDHRASSAEPAPAAAGVDCLVSYTSGCAPASGKDSAPTAAREAPAHEAPLGADAAAAAPNPPPAKVLHTGSAEGRAAAARDAEGHGLLGLRLRSAAGKGPAGPKGVLERVEGLLQGRGARGAVGKRGGRTP